MDAAAGRDGSMNQRELLEWFEDVATSRTRAVAVELVTNDAAERLRAIRSLYHSIGSHPRFGSGWPALGAPASITPDDTAPHAGPPPGALWFALVGSPHPYAEMGQLVDQLERLKRFVHADQWVNQAAAGEFRTVLSHASVQGPGDAAALGFGFLDPVHTDRVASLGAAVRVLDETVTRTRLGRDGGALGLDGPRTRSRALVTAGWLMRLAKDAPVVLAIDDAHRAGPFAVDLVRAVLDSGSRILVVLAGEPAAQPSAMSSSIPVAFNRAAPPPAPTGRAPASLGGSLGGVATAALMPVSLTADDAGRLAAALAGVHPTGLFTRQHAHRWADHLGAGDHRALIASLTSNGWLRPITTEVSGFASTARLHVARAQAAELLDAASLQLQASLCAAVAATTTEDDELAHVVAVAAAAANAPAASDARWTLATTLAVRGQIGTGERLGRAAITAPERSAARDLWRASGWADPLESAPTTTPTGIADGVGGSPADARAAVVRAASPATAPDQVAATLAPLGDASDLAMLHRLAAARSLLAAGELELAAAAIGPDAPEWLSPGVLAQLDQLSPFRDTPGVVARSVDVMTNLHAIAELRRAVPASAALGHVLLARLDLLERYGRLETAADAVTIADEAVTIFAGSGQEPPSDWWRARRTRAWTRARHGDAATAVEELDALVADQRRKLADDDPAVLDSRLWLGRALLLAGRAGDAHRVLHAVRDARRRTHLDHHPDLLLARQWHAAAKVEGGDPAAAITELQEVTRHRAGGIPVDDEDHLATQHLLGSALAAAGRWTDAVGVLDHTLARRSLVDLADAPRVLSARYSRAACLMFLERRTEAIAELDGVVALAAATTDAARVGIKARNARGVARLMSGDWAGALGDLDDVVAHHAALAPADDEVLLCARQQRAECLRWLGRNIEAAGELDAVIAATAGWPADQPLVATVRRQRAALTTR